ncbi:hypothetical protein GCM10007874_08500 [Labrys miyagiensis]|uniref:Uncharacterized protein n=1 Tax=Labrys miyagiensis TaxID=346912 RepID=A0ABQ6CD29_9HYPH|nr:hypothetical protein [Labrys miyagiensis]GLS17835.1 hypothetical protein GCM10007874_08500 [Labrys miyagiensis]
MVIEYRVFENRRLIFRKAIVVLDLMDETVVQTSTKIAPTAFKEEHPQVNLSASNVSTSWYRPNVPPPLESMT